MKIKQTPQDFIVDEIYNLDDFKNKEENKIYYYFKLTKTDYTQFKALDMISKVFNISRKEIHFAGTKDKVGVTTQIISLARINKNNFEKNLEYFNSMKDLEMKYIGEFNGRINLGDNIGNKFEITVRKLDKNTNWEKLLNNKIEKISKEGVLNFFDKQRFGFANNSHIIGKYILRNEVELAVREILTSLPKEPTQDLIDFVEFISKNWEKIKEQNIEIINQAIDLIPNFFREAKDILNHLKNAKNDFPGAFRRLHKKLRKIYVNAYQSYIFNESIKKINQDIKELELINFNSIIDLDIVKKILDKDKITLEMFKLPSMPELRTDINVKRKIKIYPKNIEIKSIKNDELNENYKKVIVNFELSSGEYATNIITQLFNQE